MSKPLTVGDLVCARGQFFRLDAGVRLLVPPDEEPYRWVGLDVGGQPQPPDGDVVDVIGEWCSGERIRVHGFTEIADWHGQSGVEVDPWYPPGREVDVPGEVRRGVDRLLRGLDVHWKRFSVADDRTRWVSVGTSQPDQARAVMSELPDGARPDVFATPWTLADCLRAEDVVVGLGDELLVGSSGGKIDDQGRRVTTVFPIWETAEFLDRIGDVPEGCIESHPWIHIAGLW